MNGVFGASKDFLENLKNEIFYQVLSFKNYELKLTRRFVVLIDVKLKMSVVC